MSIRKGVPVVAREFTTEEREGLAEKGHAMDDGSFPIANREDLENAIRAVGRARPNTEERRASVRRHIMKRARALGLEELIPDSWNSDGSLDGGAENHLKVTRPLARLKDGRTDWYRVQNNAGSTPEIFIYDEIGYFGTASNAFVQDLAGLSNDSGLVVNLNSPGGDVFDGIAIYQALLDHPSEVTIKINGLAASIASVIAMAGDKVVMGAKSSVMIHEGFTFASGDAATMRKTADLLDRISDNIASVYADRAGGSSDEWRERMREETWYSAEEALAAGLVDEIEGRRSTKNDDFDLSVYKHAGRDNAPDPVLGNDCAAKVSNTAEEEIPTSAPMEEKDAEVFPWDPAAFLAALKEGINA